MKEGNKLIQSYITQLTELFSGEPWIEETFESKLKELPEDLAFSKPKEDIHSVGEILSHLIVWRKEILQRVKEKKSPSVTMESSDNWKKLETLKQDGLFQLLNEFNESQELLIEFLKTKTDSFLSTKDNFKNVSFDYYIRGLIHHDAYHLGQIGLLLKYFREMK